MNTLNYITFIPFIATLFYFILLVILLGSRKNKIARYYIYYIMAMIIWSMGSFMMKTDIGPSSLFWNRILLVGLISMPILFYHFTIILTKIKNQKWLLSLGYLVCAIFILTNFMGLIMKDAYVENNEFIYELGPLAPLMAIWSLAYLIIAFTNILMKVRTNEIPFIRVKLILLGLILVIIGGLLNLIPSIGKYPLDIVLNTINAVFIVYSIYRHKFLEIKLIVKKGLAYSLYTVILTSVYIIAIIGIQQNVSRNLKSNNILLTISIAFLLAVTLSPLKNIIQHGIDRLFYKGKIESQKILKEFSQIINNLLDLEEIISVIMNSVVQRLKPKRIFLALKENQNDYIVYNEGRKQFCCLNLKDENPIIKWFLQGHSILTISDIYTSPSFASLWRIEKKQLLDLDAEFLIPIKYRGEITGILILSERLNGDAYTVDEVDLVHSLVNQAAAVIENAKLYEEAKEQAITDGLTKLKNHRYFHEVLGNMVNEKEYDIFSIAIIDVDLFKFYNDLYGHPAGDKILRKMAEILTESVREIDTVFRYGGEEFAIILPSISGKEALDAIEVVRKAVESSFMNLSDEGGMITISAGIASFPSDSTHTEELINLADKAMYFAKQSGRNQVFAYSTIEKDSHQKVENSYFVRMQDQIRTAYLSSIYALAATIDAKDKYTYGHSENVAKLAAMLATEAGFSPDKVEIIKSAGLLHDIGKIGIPEHILTKPDALTPEEYVLMKKHVDISVTIIKHIPNLIEVIPAIMSHHEKYDGTGYPIGRKGKDIPIEGRCLAIVDAFDAMISDRPYRKALRIDAAISEMERNKGTQFDPELTDLFIGLIRKEKLDYSLEKSGQYSLSL